MKALVFDSGPIISLAMNNLLWILDPLKSRLGGQFYITPSVEKEVVERPLYIKKFEFEALQVAKVIDDKVLELSGSKIPKKSKELMALANHCFTSKGKYIRIVQEAEIEILTLASELGTKAAVIDERTVRLLLEDPENLRTLLEKRLHSSVQMQAKNVKFIQERLGDISIIRSAELVTVAFSLGLLDGLIPKMQKGKDILLDAVLWGVKSNGCAITENEIEEIKKVMLDK